MRKILFCKIIYKISIVKQSESVGDDIIKIENKIC